jgi:hypothetical protein
MLFFLIGCGLRIITVGMDVSRCGELVNNRAQ